MTRNRDGREEEAGLLGGDLGDNCVGSEMCKEEKRWWSERLNWVAALEGTSK